MPEPLNRVILSFPSRIHLTKEAGSDAPRSWNQLAVTGKFVSKKYGEFSITKDDLSMMLRNFEDVTPKAPTELPIDYDHLSMDPKKPGDGVAAGWLKKVELREDGNELWGEIEWTPDAAEHIGKKEYRFVSPSFVKDHQHKDGRKIGTTLLAAAITNHPFLEGMKALTLLSAEYSNSMAAMGDLALVDAVQGVDKQRAAVHLAEVGQRVTFKDDTTVNPELSAEERGETYHVKEIDGEGDHQFVRLTMVDGTTKMGWFRVDQLDPADAPQKEENSPMPKNTQEQSDTIKAATRFAEVVKQRGGTAGAILLASNEDPDGAEAYRLVGLGITPLPEAEPVVSLSVKPGAESFDQLAQRYAAEKNVPLREAVHEVGRLRPDLAEAR